MSIANHKHKVDQVSALIQSTVKAVNSILDEDELQGIRRRVVALIHKANYTLQGAAGIYVPNANMQEVNELIARMEPLESVGGEPLNRVQPVSMDSLDIKQYEKDEFTRKRDDLYQRFPTMSYDQIFSLLKEPNGSLLIRSVARIAGVSDFREVEIDQPFVDDLKMRIGQKNYVGDVVEHTSGDAALDSDIPEDEGADDDNVQTGAPTYDHLKKEGKGQGTKAKAPKPTTKGDK